MSEFNSCAHLHNEADLLAADAKYDEILSAGSNPLGYLLNIQNTLQEALAEKLGRLQPPKAIKTKGELYEFLLSQKIAMDDEWRELIEAVGGMSKPEKDRSAVWKKWKGAYEDIREEKIADMPDTDRLELMFELVDFAHFFFNCLLAVGIDERELFRLYYLKNAENFARQERGY